LALALTSFQSIFAEIPKKEKEALMDLYHSTGGAHWDITWDTQRPVQEWHGIKVVDGHIVEINLFENNLTGYIPASIRNLTHLKYLNLAFNAISGTFPNDLVN